MKKPRKAPKKNIRVVEVGVEWGDELHWCPMSLRTWKRIESGFLVTRKEPYFYEGKRYTGEWTFNADAYGSLLVTYDGAGVAFQGYLSATAIHVASKQITWKSIARLRLQSGKNILRRNTLPN